MSVAMPVKEKGERPQSPAPAVVSFVLQSTFEPRRKPRPDSASESLNGFIADDRSAGEFSADTAISYGASLASGSVDPSLRGRSVAKEKDPRVPLTKRERTENAQVALQKERLSRPSLEPETSFKKGPAEEHMRDQIFSLTKGFDEFPLLKMMFDAPYMDSPTLSPEATQFEVDLKEEEMDVITELMSKLASLIRPPSVSAFANDPTAIVRPSYCFFVLASRIAEPIAKNFLTLERNLCAVDDGWGLDYHWIIRTFDSFADPGDTRPYSPVINLMSFTRLLSVLIFEAKRASNDRFPDGHFKRDFFHFRLPEAIRRVDERLERRFQISWKPHVLYNGLTTVPPGKPKNVPWPPHGSAETLKIDSRKFLLGLEEYTQQAKAVTHHTLEETFEHSSEHDRGTCISFQLLEPEVIHILSMFESTFTTFFAAFCDFPLDIDDMDDNPYNDAHMSFDAFFRFCAAFELYPLASRHVIQTIYKHAELTQAMFTPAEFGWVKTEAVEIKQRENRTTHLEWTKIPIEEMTPVMREALRIMATFVEFADNRLLRSRDLFVAMDHDGHGAVDAEKMDHALTILRTAHPRASQLLAPDLDEDGNPLIVNTKCVLRLINGQDPDDESIDNPTISLELLDWTIQDFRTIGAGDGQFMFKSVEDMNEKEIDAFGMWSMICKIQETARVSAKALWRNFDKAGKKYVTAREFLDPLQALVKQWQPSIYRFEEQGFFCPETEEYLQSMLFLTDKNFDGFVTEEEFCETIRVCKRAIEHHYGSGKQVWSVVKKANQRRDVRVFGPSAFLEAIMKIGLNYLNFHGSDTQARLHSSQKVLWTIGYVAVRFEKYAHTRQKYLDLFYRKHPEAKVKDYNIEKNRAEGRRAGRMSFALSKTQKIQRNRPPRGISAPGSARYTFLPDELKVEEVVRRQTVLAGGIARPLSLEELQPQLVMLDEVEDVEADSPYRILQEKQKLGQDPMLPSPTALSRNLRHARRTTRLLIGEEPAALRSLVRSGSHVSVSFASPKSSAVGVNIVADVEEESPLLRVDDVEKRRSRKERDLYWVAKAEAMREELTDETVHELDEIERILAVTRQEIEPVEALEDLVLVLPRLFHDFPSWCLMPRPDSEVRDDWIQRQAPKKDEDELEVDIGYKEPADAWDKEGHWHFDVTKRWLHLMRNLNLLARRRELQRKMEAQQVRANEDCSTCGFKRYKSWGNPHCHRCSNANHYTIDPDFVMRSLVQMEKRYLPNLIPVKEPIEERFEEPPEEASPKKGRKGKRGTSSPSSRKTVSPSSRASQSPRKTQSNAASEAGSSPRRTRNESEGELPQKAGEAASKEAPKGKKSMFSEAMGPQTKQPANPAAPAAKKLNTEYTDAFAVAVASRIEDAIDEKKRVGTTKKHK
jgi:Ca2+-binding EF-hand superfamily protein